MDDSPLQVDQSYSLGLGRCYKSEVSDMLSEAATLAQWFIAEGIGPMDIKGIHEAAVASLIADDDAEALVGAHRFLLEVLFAYGAAYSALSERLLAEADAADLARSEDAEQAERDRLELLAGVSHELGNPLMIVKVNVASIRKFLEERGNWPEDLSQREADVEFAVDRMLSLREELLAASRNEQRELEVVAMPLGHVLRRVVRWARMSAADKSIELVEDHSADLPYVMADDGALQSIFTNLLSNAIRYTKSGGTVKVTGTAEGAEVVVTVADTGIGISEDEQLHIYERFYRTDEAKRVVSFGVGLGLAITRDLVSALSGTIKVASEPGVGSTFRVSLPLAQELKKDVTGPLVSSFFISPRSTGVGPPSPARSTAPTRP